MIWLKSNSIVHHWHWLLIDWLSWLDSGGRNVCRLLNQIIIFILISIITDIRILQPLCEELSVPTASTHSNSWCCWLYSMVHVTNCCLCMSTKSCDRLFISVVVGTRRERVKYMKRRWFSRWQVHILLAGITFVVVGHCGVCTNRNYYQYPSHYTHILWHNPALN